ncbi:MAG: polysaccharide pyruvyl transferase family protein [Sphingomicrobium sp.]
MKIGVLTFHKCINYGSYWQARCLVEAIQARGHDAEILDHNCRCVRRAEMRCALQPELPKRTPPHELKSYAEKTRRVAKAVARLPMSQSFSLHEPDTAADYDAIIVGSDEVWNFRHPWYGSKPIFFGDGLNASRLISYGASFGNHSAWDGIDPAWACKLKRFSALSVRDENSRHLVLAGINREAEIVLDPCLLFPEPLRVKPRTGAPYAVVYGYGFPQWLQSLARRWSERTGVGLVSIGYSNDFAHEQRIAAGPVEFASLMAGARAVITNFFHGCVFALANGKPWAAFPSDYRAIKIPDLAATVAAEHRLLDQHIDDSAFAELLGEPMQAEVRARLEELGARSHAYLDAALA